MLIGIDASRANGNEKTGVGWYAYHLIQKLKTGQRPDIRFVLYTNEPLRGELAELPDNWSEKVLKWPLKRLWTQVRLSWEMLVHPPDVLFIPAHVFPLIHPQKTVMTVHDIAAVGFPQSYSWFERWYSVWSAGYAAKKLWRVIVPSQFTKDELMKLRNLEIKKLPERMRVISHGYDERYEKRHDQNANKILEKYNLRKPYLLSVGRLEEKKNTMRIIEAFNNLKFKNLNLKLFLAGLPGYGYEKVKTAIEKSPFKQDIIQPGWVDERDLPSLMQAADVFVFPSLAEGFGLPILQAFSCGIPVVASRGTVLEEVGGDAAVYADPQNPEEIAQAVFGLMQDGELRRQKIELGLERIKQFSWEKCAKETLNILLGD